MAGELEDAELGALARHWLLYDLAELGELDQARARHAELERIAAELQQPLYRHSALAWRGVWAGLAGRFDEAEQLARDSVRLAEGAGAPDARTHFTAQLVAIRREQGRLDELLPEIERLARGDAHAAVWRSLRAARLSRRGRPRSSQRRLRLRRGRTRDRRAAMLWLTATASLCEAAAELGDADGAARLYVELAPYADRLVQWSFTGNAGSVQRLLGRAAAVAGRRDDAREHFEAALACHAELEAPALLARTRCDYGEFLSGGTRADRSRAHQHPACRRRRGAPPGNDRRRRASGTTRLTGDVADDQRGRDELPVSASSQVGRRSRTGGCVEDGNWCGRWRN